MRHPRILRTAAPLLPAGCQPPRVAPRIADGRMVEASHEDGDHAVLRTGGMPYRLAIARSASGACYAGGGWQGRTRGTRQGELALLPPGKVIASAPGIACHAW